MKVPRQKRPVLRRINCKRYLLLLVQNVAIRNDKVDVLAKIIKTGVHVQQNSERYLIALAMRDDVCGFAYGPII